MSLVTGREGVLANGHADSAVRYRVADMENQIGAGLIEEVIQVAEGELKLVKVMAEAKV